MCALRHAFHTNLTAPFCLCVYTVWGWSALYAPLALPPEPLAPHPPWDIQRHSSNKAHRNPLETFAFFWRGRVLLPILFEQIQKQPLFRLSLSLPPHPPSFPPPPFTPPDSVSVSQILARLTSKSQQDNTTLKNSAPNLHKVKKVPLSSSPHHGDKNLVFDTFFPL